jgi:hypothetical protein
MAKGGLSDLISTLSKRCEVLLWLAFLLRWVDMASTARYISL